MTDPMSPPVAGRADVRTILAIDPGPTRSAYVILAMGEPTKTAKLPNEDVLALAAEQVCLTGPQLAASGLVDEAKVTAIVRDISKAVCTQIYAVASSRGKMCV